MVVDRASERGVVVSVQSDVRLMQLFRSVMEFSWASN